MLYIEDYRRWRSWRWGLRLEHGKHDEPVCAARDRASSTLSLSICRNHGQHIREGRLRSSLSMDNRTPPQNWRHPGRRASPRQTRTQVLLFLFLFFIHRGHHDRCLRPRRQCRHLQPHPPLRRQPTSKPSGSANASIAAPSPPTSLTSETWGS